MNQAARRERQRRKTKEREPRSKTFSINRVLLVIFSVFSLSILVYAVVLIPIGASVLKHHGSKIKAMITSNESSWWGRYTSINYLYEFTINGKTYTGNSLIKVEENNSNHIGDSIEVLYFDFWPSFNRPIYFYNEEQ